MPDGVEWDSRWAGRKRARGNERFGAERSAGKEDWNHTRYVLHTRWSFWCPLPPIEKPFAYSKGNSAQV